MAVPKLLELLSLKGQRRRNELSAQDRSAGGRPRRRLPARAQGLPGYVARRCAPLPRRSAEHACACDTDKGHGRIEIRTAALSTAIDWLQESPDWPGLAAIGEITATREIDGKTSVETRYYLASSAFKPERFDAIIRSHRGIEDGLHRALGVVMDEGQARNGKDHRRQDLALLRKLARNPAKLEPSKGSMRGTLKQAGWDNAFLAQILLHFVNFQMR